MLKKMFVLAVLFLIPIGPSEIVTACADSVTIEKNATKILVIDGIVGNVSFFENVTRPYGWGNNPWQTT